MSDPDVDEIVQDTDFPMDIALIGNPKVRSRALRWLTQHNQLHRVMLCTDSPGGAGVFTVGMLRSVMEISAIEGLPAPIAVALATGNTADIFGLATGRIELGREADIVVLDAPMGSAADSAMAALERGDVPGVSAVLVDGEIKVLRSWLTYQAKRQVEITYARHD